MSQSSIKSRGFVYGSDASRLQSFGLPSTRSASVTADVINASELTGTVAEQWMSLRARTRSLATPFFSPQFTRVVGRVRPESKIAVISKAGRIAGFLPFEFLSRSMIGPFAKGYNDAHGLVCNGAHPLSYREALKAIGATSYRFHALAGPGLLGGPFIMGQTRSFLADLEAHPEGYVEFLESNRATIFKQRRKTKKMVKDLGPLRLEWDCRDEQAFEKLIELKRDQYQRTYIYDLLGVSWAREMLRTLWEENTESCRGLLSVLYAGDTLVAAHFGMLEGDLLHYWFPTYDPDYHVYSPGTAMFLEISKAATKAGVKKIDLGCGEQPYKEKFVDTISEMPFGCVTSSTLTLVKELSRQSITNRIKQIPGKQTLKRMLRGVWPSFGESKYR